jgi:APA family basic amino acid/polyamine antiporter
MHPATPVAQHAEGTTPPAEFHRALGLFDSVMVVAGIMVGSGIFIVSAEI